MAKGMNWWKVGKQAKGLANEVPTRLDRWADKILASPDVKKTKPKKQKAPIRQKSNNKRHRRGGYQVTKEPFQTPPADPNFVAYDGEAPPWE